jgi:hypothetical protein
MVMCLIAADASPQTPPRIIQAHSPAVVREHIITPQNNPSSSSINHQSISPLYNTAHRITCNPSHRIQEGGGTGVREENKTYLEVISKVVPKIWARTNSAIFVDVREGRRGRDLNQSQRDGDWLLLRSGLSLRLKGGGEGAEGGEGEGKVGRGSVVDRSMGGSCESVTLLSFLCMVRRTRWDGGGLRCEGGRVDRLRVVRE